MNNFEVITIQKGTITILNDVVVINPLGAE